MNVAMRNGSGKAAEAEFPGVRTALDGSAAVVAMETAASEAAGAYPITPSTQMGEGWAAAMAAGEPNVHGRQLLFFEPEGEHAAAAVTAGLSMTGLRSTNFSSGQGIAYMHESLYAAAGKRLTYVLNVACRAMTKHALNVHAGHDDYHAVDDTGFFQVFAKDVQSAADLNLIAHRLAELSLNPGIVAQDGFLTSHVIETLRLPERELVRRYLGDPADVVACPTPAQRMVFGKTRRRIPEMFDLDYPAMLGVVQNQDSYEQGVAAQRPFYFDHVRPLADRAMDEFATLTGRRYARVRGYRLDDAEWVLAGQGSVVSNAEAVCDWLREHEGLRVGVLDVTMFRPFPADLVTHLLRGKKAVAVLERADQPLAVDAPLLREIRAAMGQGVENARARRDDGRAAGDPPHPGLAACLPESVPEFFSGCFGLGSRDLQPGDLIAAVRNMRETGARTRQFYLGIDFVRPDTRLPKLQIWQEELLQSYPRLDSLSLRSAGDEDLMPEGSLSIRIHSIGGWGAITMGKNLAVTAGDLLGLWIKANPKYGSEKKGQPTTFYATLAKEPVRLNCELRHVHVVLSPDPNVFRHSNPLAGLAEGGVFILQHQGDPAGLWAALPQSAQHEIHEKKIRVLHLDAFRIASDEASDPDLRYRMQGTAFLGAFFRSAPLLHEHGLTEEALFEGLQAQLRKKFGHRGARVVEDNLRVIRRGFDDVKELDTQGLAEAGSPSGAVPHIPDELDRPKMQHGLGHTGRFWEQVCHLYKSGEDGIADPFAAFSAIPAATSTIRDMTDVRFEVPEFVAEKCTGCSQCWTQCPDSAIPGVVSSIEDVLAAAMTVAGEGGAFERMNQVVGHLARECRRALKTAPFHTFPETLRQAYDTIARKLGLDPERRASLDAEFARVAAALADFPLAKTAPFFDGPEAREKGSGGLLSITVNPEACKGCNVCVEVCPDGALRTVSQDEGIVETLRRNWHLWKVLPDTHDRYVQIASLEEGIGVLPSLLLKKGNYRTMMGGDGACMGCGEKTAIHLVVSAVHALLQPRVEAFLAKLDRLLEGLDRKARELISAEADLGSLEDVAEGKVDVPLAPEQRARVRRIVSSITRLKDLRWRYVEGPSGRGRAPCGFSNSTGCSSVWGSTYPFNPYPFPWVNHLFQDAPSIAIGLFEGNMRKMADGFAAVRRAELELEGAYDPAIHEPMLSRLDWHRFSDEEFALCPPILAVGGDGAMLDIGFQNLSRLLASGKPIRVVVLDTQVYSNTGGQACTSGYLGQVSDMAAFGQAHHGKEEMRKELSLIALAHRGVFVLQSSQGAASHLLGGVLRGLQSKRPAVFVLHSPCPPEHGLPDDAAAHAARLAIESRAFPLMVFDPDGGATLPECLSLEGNPEVDEAWPSYELKYAGEDGKEQSMTLPLTIADWAAGEGRFRKHFRLLAGEGEEDDDLVLFHEYVAMSPENREGKIPFLWSLDGDRRLQRWRASDEMVRLAEDRLSFWSLLRQMAGVEVAGEVRDTVRQEVESELEATLAALRSEYEVKLAAIKARYPLVLAKRLAEGLLRTAGSGKTIDQLLAEVRGLPVPALHGLGGSAAGLPQASIPSPPPAGSPAAGLTTGASSGAAAGATAAAAATAATSAGATSPAATSTTTQQEAAAEEDEALVLEPTISSVQCTTCHECINLNRKMFSYNDKNQAYVKDPKAGTFRELVLAAEKCPVRIIHPGTPWNPKEKDLAKWVKRAAPFN